MALEEALSNEPITMRKGQQHTPLVTNVNRSFCCAAHEQQVLQHNKQFKEHNMYCFSMELTTGLSWLPEHGHGLACLEQMVDIALKAVHRAGWLSLQRQQIVEELVVNGTITLDELHVLEQWHTHPSSHHEEYSVFVERQFPKAKFASTLVCFMDRLNPLFFHNYSVM